MHSAFQIFTPPENPVLSLEVQARMTSKEIVRMNRFVVLARHFFDRFFDNPLTSLDGENGVRAIQILCFIAVPGLMVALSLIPSYFIFPPNTAPRAYWARVSDHYFYVMYSSVAMGAATVFEWNLLFPDLIDVQVLTPLPVPARKLFAARIASLAAFVSLSLLATGLFGAVLLPLIAEEPSVLRHFIAHVIAVAAGGFFTAGFFVALQGFLLNIFGDRFFRWISAALQGLSLAVLLIVLFLFPLLSENLRLLLTSGNHAALWFPPFWFLGIYQVLLEGGRALPVFFQLAAKGGWALLLVLSLACLTYPLAYRRKMRSTIEGTVAKSSRNRLAEAKVALLHSVLIFKPAQRAVYHFTTRTLKRAPHHRVFLSMYAGAAFALLIAVTVELRQDNTHLALVFSRHGLLAAVPIVALLAVVGLKGAFLSPVELQANWAFHVVGRRPNEDHLVSTQRWTLLRSLSITATVLLLVQIIGGAAFAHIRLMMAQLLVAQGLCVLLIDILFLRFLSVPFTVPLAYSKRNIAVTVTLFLLLFPGYIQLTVDTALWTEHSLWHFIPIAAFFLVTHILLQRKQRELIRERADWPEDGYIDEFPQRLGLS
ncbi:hypothetical protein H7849_23305 [Alloacidobacterium dinghuense]|uniref:Uncharacterized protein n=1 Tax=Alloacidobacterium dinghuense TaxID=2763107 RepID=A0A7G8BH99_9BACT|nr:hypothetical protein [Alloacidobacterium dinghuense]QNI31919.1 hypothetical protein H7849_23305 [Alloacidobacterium dinghuense]